MTALIWNVLNLKTSRTNKPLLYYCTKRNELSKGMMQKVSICCALAIRPKVILLDEPMVGLDPRAIKELKETVRELRDQGVTVLISTHMLEMVEDLWDVMFVMEKGKIIGSTANQKQARKISMICSLR